MTFAWPVTVNDVFAHKVMEGSQIKLGSRDPDYGHFTGHFVMR